MNEQWCFSVRLKGENCEVELKQHIEDGGTSTVRNDIMDKALAAYREMAKPSQ